MDSLTTAVMAGTTGLTFGPTINSFLQRVSGPFADELGEWGRDKFREYRFRNAIRAAEHADRILRDVTREPQPVELRILVPILEGASREDNEDISILWAALLANAANGDQGSNVLPLFPALLSQLSPIDARALDHLRKYETVATDSSRDIDIDRPSWGIAISVIQAAMVSCDDDQLDVTLDTLVALGLVQREPAVHFGGEVVVPYISDGTNVRLSSLGRRFIRACIPPEV